MKKKQKYDVLAANKKEVLLAVVYKNEETQKTDLYKSSEKSLFEFNLSLGNIVYDFDGESSAAELRALNELGGAYLINTLNANSSRKRTWFKSSFKANWSPVEFTDKQYDSTFLKVFNLLIYCTFNFIRLLNFANKGQCPCRVEQSVLFHARIRPGESVRR